jgi:hypothetical protein
MPLVFIVRTALLAALLFTAVQETGWATGVLLSLVLLRFEIENILFARAKAELDAQVSKLDQQASTDSK